MAAGFYVFRAARVTMRVGAPPTIGLAAQLTFAARAAAPPSGRYLNSLNLILLSGFRCFSDRQRCVSAAGSKHMRAQRLAKCSCKQRFDEVTPAVPLEGREDVR
ncbi:unnamed protein product [Merluccius merluccius]